MKYHLSSLLAVLLWTICSSTGRNSDVTQIKGTKDKGLLKVLGKKHSNMTTAAAGDPQKNVLSKRSVEKVLKDDAGKFRKSNLTSEEKKKKAVRAFKRFDKSESDAEVGAFVDKVKSVLGKIREKMKKQLQATEHKNKKTKMEVKKNPVFDKKEGMPKSILEVNADADMTDYLYEGDIMVTPEMLDALEAESKSDGDREKRAAPTTYGKWPNAARGIIYYKFDSNILPYKVVVIRQGLQFWEDNICVDFEPAPTSATKGLLFTNGTGCYAVLGSYIGFQPVSIGDRCQYFGVVTHELGHALGMSHEQQRPDRNKYVQINNQYIQDGLQDHYTIMKASEAAPFTTPYDYGSIMHYDAGSATYPAMSTYNSNFQQTMGQHKAPSFYDIREMNNYFGCNAACASSTTQCQNGGYADPKNCARCKCPSGFGDTLCDAVQPPEGGVTCGGVLTATTSYQTLNVTVGTSSTTDAHQTCYWHIKSAPGTLVEVMATSVSASCMPGCRFSALELKMGLPTGVIDGINVKSPFEGAGYRFCCRSDDKVNIPFVSSTNLVPVIGFGDDTLRFTIRYRQVVPGEVTSTPTTLTTSAASCIDQNPTCSSWANIGECQKNPTYMLIYCQKSCGTCPGPAGCIDQNPTCSSWANTGECQKNPTYMLIYCQKSCGICK